MSGAESEIIYIEDQGEPTGVCGFVMLVAQLNKDLQNGSKVSVIVVNYNGMPHIDTCISSVLRQNHAEFELIFVDNASTDASLSYARTKFSDLIFVANDTNLGYAGGINAGLACATGQYIAPLNTDTEVTPNWLSNMVSFLEANPLAGAVTPEVLLFDRRDTINAQGLNIHVTGLGFCRALHRKNGGSRRPVKVPGVSGCSCLVRRHLLEQMGGAPRWCFMGNEDVILSWLLRLMGYEVYCLPESTVFHKYSLKMDPQKLFRLEKNRQLLLLSTLRPLSFLAGLPILLAIELMVIVYSLVKGPSYIRAKFRAYATVWRERSNTKQRRAQYKLLRKISDLALFRRLSWNLAWTQLWRIR